MFWADKGFEVHKITIGLFMNLYGTWYSAWLNRGKKSALEK
jgi:hypothetical protein